MDGRFGLGDSDENPSPNESAYGSKTSSIMAGSPVTQAIIPVTHPSSAIVTMVGQEVLMVTKKAT